MSFTYLQFYKFVTISLIASLCTWVWYITFWSQYYDCPLVGYSPTETVSIFDKYTNNNVLMYKTNINYCNSFTRSVYHYTPEMIYNYKPNNYIPAIKNYFGIIFESDHNYFKFCFLVFPIPIYPVFTLLIAMLIQHIYNLKDETTLSGKRYEIVKIRFNETKQNKKYNQINQLSKLSEDKIPEIDSNQITHIVESSQQETKQTNEVREGIHDDIIDEQNYIITEEKKNQ